MISVRHAPGPDGQPVEVVERKGLGHPDTLADALAERMSVAYSRHCRERFGAVLHHNLDKLYLRGGHCQTGLGTVVERLEAGCPVTGQPELLGQPRRTRYKLALTVPARRPGRQ